MRRHKKWISINYFVFPGVTDHPEELNAFLDVCRRARPNIVQMRNLNIDPDVYVDLVGPTATNPEGIRRWTETVRRELPGIRFGYFNPPRESWGDSWGEGADTA